MAATFTEVEASVRASTDQPDTGRTPQTTILALANEEYDECLRRLAAIVPDWYRAESGALAITSTATPYIDISSLATAFQILEVRRLVSGKYWIVDPAGDDPDNDPKYTWRQRGFWGSGAKIDIFPPARAVGTYIVRYCAHPGALVAAGELKLPLGGVKYLAACVSARIRHREEEDPSFMDAVRDLAFGALRANLGNKGQTVGTHGRY